MGTAGVEIIFGHNLHTYPHLQFPRWKIQPKGLTVQSKPGFNPFFLLQAKHLKNQSNSLTTSQPCLSDYIFNPRNLERNYLCHNDWGFSYNTTQQPTFSTRRNDRKKEKPRQDTAAAATLPILLATIRIPRLPAQRVPLSQQQPRSQQLATPRENPSRTSEKTSRTPNLTRPRLLNVEPLGCTTRHSEERRSMLSASHK